jgi:hypothetical protein
MKMNSKPNESHMLERVRRWRREAYEGDQTTTDSARREKLHQLAHRYGLNIAGGHAHPEG